MSEDPRPDGGNWFRYCYNNPIAGANCTGTFMQFIAAFLIGFFAGIIFSVVEQGLTAGWNNISYGTASLEGVLSGAIGMVSAITGSICVWFGKKMQDIQKLAKAGSSLQAFAEGSLAFATSTECSRIGSKCAGASFIAAGASVLTVNLLTLRTSLFLGFSDE